MGKSARVSQLAGFIAIVIMAGIVNVITGPMQLDDSYRQLIPYGT